jgi:hypothetical protein
MTSNNYCLDLFNFPQWNSWRSETSRPKTPPPPPTKNEVDYVTSFKVTELSRSTWFKFWYYFIATYKFNPNNLYSIIWAYMCYFAWEYQLIGSYVKKNDLELRKRVPCVCVVRERERDSPGIPNRINPASCASTGWVDSFGWTRNPETSPEQAQQPAKVPCSYFERPRSAKAAILLPLFPSILRNISAIATGRLLALTQFLLCSILSMFSWSFTNYNLSKCI